MFCCSSLSNNRRRDMVATWQKLSLLGNALNVEQRMRNPLGTISSYQSSAVSQIATSFLISGNRAAYVASMLHGVTDNLCK
jgi:hypothetical protein